ncbi:MAG TPA: RNA 2',3'-cyclic phosphodiesterase [Solirubrobacterales bacterium]|nr:RNA 2',3'-cyclic phosphodiesterase [Solirubrobacterales bacterium]
MAKERLKSPRARLFVALDLPEDLRDGIVAWGKRELRDPALRVAPRESLHITLAFLGYLPEREIERLEEVVARLESPAPTIELGDPVAKPSFRRARLFALPADSDGAIALQAELEGELVAQRLYKPEQRPFWPHVTVARVKSGGKGSRRPTQVSEPPRGLLRGLMQPELCRRVSLYRSELNPQGARYVPLAQVELSKNRRGGRDGR